MGVEDHDDLTNLGGKQRAGRGILGLVRSHGGIENHGFRTLDREWQEEQAWCTKGTATDVLGLLRLWVYNLLSLLKGRYLRAARYRTLTLGGFVAWIERVSAWGKGRRRRYGIVPVG